MINHVRTLLMNVNGSDVVPEWAIGDQYVPAGFKAVSLSTPLLAIRNKLFGATPDRLMLNYRLAQMLPLLHATELAEFMYVKDKRITYLPFGDDFFASSVFKPNLWSNLPGIIIQGTPAVPDLNGSTYRSFGVNVVSSVVDVQQQSPKPKDQTFDVTYTGGLSDTTVPLGDSGYYIVLPEGNLQASIEIRLRPQWELGDILTTFMSIGEPVLDAVFGIIKVEPYQTFRNLFYDHDELAFRLGGLLLAVAWRTDEILQGVQQSGS